MSKINIESKLLNKTTNEIYNINTKAIKDDDILKFYDNDILNIIDIKNNLIERKNNEYNIKLDFNNEKGIYILNNFSFDFDIKINNLDKGKNYIEIDYIIYMDEVKEYNYRIRW